MYIMHDITLSYYSEHTFHVFKYSIKPLPVHSACRVVNCEVKYSHSTWRQTWATSLWMKKKRSAVVRGRGEACGALQETPPLIKSCEETRTLQKSVGTTRSCDCVVFFLFVCFVFLTPHDGWSSFTLQRLSWGWEPIRPQRCFAAEKCAWSEKPQIYCEVFQAADVLQPLHRLHMVSSPYAHLSLNSSGSLWLTWQCRIFS